MKTNDVYFADAYVITKIEYKDTYHWTFLGKPLYDATRYYKKLKKVLVLYKNDGYEKIAIDLNTNSKYGFRASSTVGEIFVISNSLMPFNDITGNTKTNLTKRKIKKIGNQELIKLMNKE